MGEISAKEVVLRVIKCLLLGSVYMLENSLRLLKKVAHFSLKPHESINSISQMVRLPPAPSTYVYYLTPLSATRKLVYKVLLSPPWSLAEDYSPGYH